MAFRPVSIPLARGLDQNSADFALAQQDLLAATNVVFTKGGAIRGRPGTANMDLPVVAFDGFSSSTGLAAAFAKYQFAGLHTDATGTVYAQFHGRLFKRTSSNWVDMGPMFSCRRTTIAGPLAFNIQDEGGVSNLTNPVDFSSALDVGATVVSGLVPLGGTGTAGFLTYANEQAAGITTPPSYVNFFAQAYPATDKRAPGVSLANDTVFWANAAGELWAAFPGTFPSTTAVKLVTNVTTVAYSSFNLQRIWAAYDGTNYYVAYISGTTGSQSVKVIKVSGAGSVLSTLTYTPTTTTVQSVCLAVDSNTGKGLLTYTTAVPNVVSEVFTLSTLATAGLSINYGLSPANNVTTCSIINGVGWTTDHGHVMTTALSGCNALNIRTRSLSATTGSIIATYDAGTSPGSGITLAGDASVTANGWAVLFPPQLLTGRVVVGLQNSQRRSGPLYGATANIICPFTWAVVDITDAVSANVQSAYAIAAGGGESAGPVSRPAVATVRAGSLYFGAPEGLDFSANSIDKVAPTIIKLTPHAAPSVSIGSRVLFGGSVSFLTDGGRVVDAGFLVGQPAITNVSFSGFGGWTAGSYTFQAVWVYTDQLGFVHRSLPSEAATVTQPSGLQQAVVTVSVPQLGSLGTIGQVAAYGAGSVGGLAVELYASQVNPSAADPLTLAVTQSIFPTTTAGSGSIVLGAVTTTPSSVARQLYTTGNVLGDRRSPGGDRGVVVAENRVWTADERTLYPSFLLTPNVSPAWDTEVFPVDVPSAFGRVQGLCTFDDKVVAVCDNGCLVVAGPGLDRQGQGSGWSEPQRISGFGSPGPARAVCSHPQGGAFVGNDGLLYGISRSLAVQCLGTAVRDVVDAPGDLVYVPPGSNIGWDTASNPLLVYGTTILRVLDLSTGMWATWTGLTATSLAGASTGLVASVAAAPYVVQFRVSGGRDLGTDFAMSIRLNPQQMAGPGLMSGWGRLRSVNPVFKTLGTHLLSVQAYADERQALILDKAFTVGS